MVYIYDIETYSNFFCVTFRDYHQKNVISFVIDDVTNHIDELYKFIYDRDKWLVGYNSFTFDNQILNYIYINYGNLAFESGELIAYKLHNYAMSLLEGRSLFNAYNLPFRFIDLMKLSFLQKSLKLVGVSLKWHKLQDLPYPPEKRLTKEEKEKVLEYNLNDVLITEKLYEYQRELIISRYKISEKYHVEGYSESNSGLANRLLEKFYSESTGKQLFEFKYLRTPRKFFQYRQIIFPEINFSAPELEELYDFLMNFNYYEGQKFIQKVVTFKGKSYKMGIGGLHSVDGPDIFTNDNCYIIDCDVASYYPSLIINKHIKPEHLDDSFIEQYAEVKKTRLKAKHEGDEVVSYALKILLNSVFGKMLNKDHWLYDPMAGLTITINGQLLLLMLIESLELNGFEVISANTDGVITKVPFDKYQLYEKVLSEWEGKTSLSLEQTKYKKYIRRDVNNYIAITESGKVKTKGVFSKEIDINKGFNKPIVSLALYKYFVDGVEPEKTILEHKDIYDFCAAVKISEDFTNMIRYIDNRVYKEEELQRSVRYYISNRGVSLVKIKKGTNEIIQYESGKQVTIFNDFIYKHSFNEYDINYAYYIKEARKIINSIEKYNPQLKLF